MSAANIRSSIAANRKRRESSNAELEEIEAYWVEFFSGIPRDFRSHIKNLLKEFGTKKVIEAIGITADKCWVTYGSAPLKYLHGVCRRWRNE